MLEIRTSTPAPFFTVQVGDLVVMQLDVLVELARSAPGLPPTWLTLPAGTEGRVLGYRDRDGESFAVVEVALDRRVIVFVREAKIGLAPRGRERSPARVRVAPPPRARRRHRG